jgi:membrane-associated protein
MPLILAASVVTVVLVRHLFALPSDAELMQTAKHFFDTYGYLAVFLSAVLEGALIVGLYYPGALVIFLSVILAGHDIPHIATIVLVVTGAFTLGLSADYVLGKYGWYRLLLKVGLRHELERAQARFHKRGALAIALTAWDINVSSFTATAAGILRYPYGRFVAYTFFAFLAWNSFWATIIYFIGQQALEFTGGNYTYPVVALTVWVLIVTGKHVLENMRGELREAPAALD